MQIIAIRLDVDASTQYATAYDANDKPVATVARKRVYDKGFEWTIYKLDGSLWFKSNHTKTLAKQIARRIAANAQLSATLSRAVSPGFCVNTMPGLKHP